MSHFEAVVRTCLARTIRRPADQAGALDLTADFTYGYGLTSLDLIVLVSDICNDANVPLTRFDEDAIARLHAPADIVDLLNAVEQG
jgi:acyl carrier protein